LTDSSGGSGKLHHVERLTLLAPLRAGRVVRDFLADVLVLERLGVLRQIGHLRPEEVHLVRRPDRGRGTRFLDLVARGPTEAAFQQRMEAGVAPGALVVAPGGVEDPTLALRPHPRPRLLPVALRAVFEDSAVLVVVLRVDVGLIPALEALEPLHDRVVGLGDDRAEGAGVVALELGANQLDVLRRVLKAERGAVDGNEALAALDILEERLLLLRRDLRDVGVDHQAVVTGECVRVERVGLIGVFQVNAAFGHDRLKLAVAVVGPVSAVVAEKEDLDRLRLVGGKCREAEQAGHERQEDRACHE